MQHFLWSITSYTYSVNFFLQFGPYQRIGIKYQYATYSGSWVQSSTYNENGITYDLNGNIGALKRYKGGDSATDYIDNLTYRYSGNQLIGVRDDASGDKSKGFSDGKAGDASVVSNTSTWEYTYDKSGNLTKDWNKLIGGISYNHLNLPVSVGFSTAQGANPVNYIKYTYSANGTKLKKSVENNALGTTTRTYYFGNFEYGNDKVLMYIHTDEGRIRYVSGSYKYDYYLKDHLGNTRVVFADEDANGTPELLQVDGYYPFGMRLGEANRVSIGGKTTEYMYNGKELQEDFNLDWYDYGARFYDPVIVRTTTQDPMAETFYSESPYSFMGNNPIINTDPTGMVYSPYYDENGDFLGVDEKGFAGQVMVTSADAYKNADGSVNSKSVGESSDTKSFDDAGLTKGAQGRVLTDIVNKSLNDGNNIKGDIKISVTDGKYNFTARDATPNNLDIKAGNWQKYYETTVENVRNTVNQHEIRGHVLGGISGSDYDHYKAYKMQVDHLSFATTTKKHQSEVMYLFAKYGFRGSYDITKNSRYSKLYYYDTDGYKLHMENWKK